MTRINALLLVAAFWAAIFLPGLGAIELKGEEGRRILPGMAMLDSGNWVVPYIGGEPYLRKPPLVNWLIAGSTELCGVRNEWSARLPSTLGVLALGLVIAGVCTSWLGARTAAAAALFSIANVAMIEKGRLAEIEAVYVALSGIALVTWLAWSEQGRSRWLVWTVPFIFNGFALLAKSPLHLLFFYAVVLARPRGRRELFSIPHLCGGLLMAGIFAAWAFPYFQATAALGEGGEEADAAGVWQEQMVERFGGGDFVVKDWLLGIPRGLSNFLPWLLLVPLWWKRPAADAWFRPVRNVTTALYVGFLVIPGFLPRYTMPLLVPAGLLLSVTLRDSLRLWSGSGGRELRGNNLRLAIGGSALAALVVVIYAVFAVPRIAKHDDVRPVGRAISAAIPAGQTLCAYDVKLQPLLFYISQPITYETKMSRLPSEVPWVLARSKATEKFRSRWKQVDVRGEFGTKGGKLQLLSLSGKKE